MKPADAITMLQAAAACGASDIEAAAVQFACDNAESVFDACDMRLVSEATIAKLIGHDALDMRELRVFKTVQRWSAAVGAALDVRADGRGGTLPRRAVQQTDCAVRPSGCYDVTRVCCWSVARSTQGR